MVDRTQYAQLGIGFFADYSESSSVLPTADWYICLSGIKKRGPFKTKAAALQWLGTATHRDLVMSVVRGRQE